MFVESGQQRDSFIELYISTGSRYPTIPVSSSLQMFLRRQAYRHLYNCSTTNIAPESWVFPSGINLFFPLQGEVSVSSEQSDEILQKVAEMPTD